MNGYKAERVNCPVRLNKSDYEKSKIKLATDNLKYQRLMEILFLEYLKDNKKIMEILGKYAGPENDKKRTSKLDPLETDQLMKLLETESPIRLLEQMSDEVKGK